MPRSARLVLITLAALALLGILAFIAHEEWLAYQYKQALRKAGSFCIATAPGTPVAAITARARADADQTGYAVYLDGVVVEYAQGCACRIPIVQGKSGAPRLACAPPQRG